MVIANRRLNLKKSSLDSRDHKIIFNTTKASTAPTSIDLSRNCPSVYDQLDIGSCTANAASTMFSFICRKNQNKLILPSRLFLYYTTRTIQGTIDSDSGASLRDTMRALRSSGVCPETMWIYNEDLLYQRPGSDCYTTALDYQALSYASISIGLSQMKNAIKSGFVFVMGILVYSSFVSNAVARTGMVPVPNTTRESYLGGHAICVIGFDDRRQAFLCRNSWGTGWGLRGNFYLPYSYAINRNLSFDAWTLYTAESGPTYAITKPT